MLQLWITKFDRFGWGGILETGWIRNFNHVKKETKMKNKKWIVVGSVALLALLLLVIGYAVVNSSYKITRANQASASVFSSVIAKLTGIFPQKTLTTNFLPDVAYFKFFYPPGLPTFIFKLTDPKKILEARGILAERPLIPRKTQRKTHVMGNIVKGTTPYNPLYDYHLDPDSIRFFENAIELCDASIAPVYPVLYCRQYLPGPCPWCPCSSILLEEVRLDQRSAVVGRYIFYNNSSFDGNNPLANNDDDRALAYNKSALMPGTKATFINYTSYSRGINGIMIDISRAGKVSAADFQFKVGNGDDTSAWVNAPAPSSITVRAGFGKNLSDRVTIVWPDNAIRPDNAIKKQWLQVKVLKTANTNLAKDDVFYFGNAIGEVGYGNLPNFAKVDLSDVNKINQNFSPSVSILSPYDINRDKSVDSVDSGIAMANRTTFLTALRFIMPW